MIRNGLTTKNALRVGKSIRAGAIDERNHREMQKGRADRFARN
jgi:hypothetical protein